MHLRTGCTLCGGYGVPKNQASAPEYHVNGVAAVHNVPDCWISDVLNQVAASLDNHSRGLSTQCSFLQHTTHRNYIELAALRQVAVLNL